MTEAATPPDHIARNNVQRDVLIEKAGFTPAFSITSSCHSENAAGVFRVNECVKPADTPDFVRVVAHA